MLTMMAAAAANTPASWIDWLLSLKDFWLKALTLGTVALTLWLIFGQFRQAARLIYHMKAIPEDEEESPPLKSIPAWKWPRLLIRDLFRTIYSVGLTFWIILRNINAVALRKYTIADVTRIWIEHDIFGMRLRGSWANRSEKAKDSRTECLITVPHPGIVSKAAERINRYTARVAELEAHSAGEKPGFFCPIKIESGYIAPLHLLSGLLVHFDDTWPKILNGFEAEAELDDTLRRLKVSRNFQQIQTYIYYCWLLWGPSIPVCGPTCTRWGQDMLWLQYGFGDENNSINIVGERGPLTTKMTTFLAGTSAAAGADKGVMAVPALVQGRLYYDHVSTFSGSEAAGAAGVKKSGSATESRSLLFVDEIRSDIKGGERSLYYSGYLWVMFVVMAEDGDRFLPLHPEDRRNDGRENPLKSRLPWKDSIPFFEHGNFADAETCMFGKEQLVQKALTGLVALVEQNGKDGFPLQFAYSCAIDDPNCRWCDAEGKAPKGAKRYEQLAFPALAGGRQIVEIMEDRLTEEMKNPESEIGKLVSEGRVTFKRFSSEKGGHPHSACNLPAHVDHHLEVLEALNEQIKLEEEARRKVEAEKKKKGA